MSVVEAVTGPATVVERGGHWSASRTTQDFGSFWTPLSWFHRYLVNQRFAISFGSGFVWLSWWK